MPVNPTRLGFGTGYSTLATDPASNAVAVAQIYHGLLGRQPDAVGYARWLDKLNAGADLRATANAIAATPEASAFQSASDNDFVSSLYVNLLGREPDEAGLSAWVTYLEVGHSRGDLVLQIATSTEAKEAWTRANPQGIEAADQASLIVAMVYDSAFGRAPDSEGLVSWTQQLRSGAMTLENFTKAVAQSAEFTAEFSELDATAQIVRLYANSFNRVPAAEEIAGHLQSLQSGTSLGALLLQFALSNEQAASFASSLEAGVTDGFTPVTFASNLMDGVLTFSGTATGPIVLTTGADGASFTRAGIMATVPDLEQVDSIILDGASLEAQATALSGKQVQGSGALILSGPVTTADLSRISESLEVTLRLGTSQDLSANTSLGEVDAIVVAEDAVVTLSAGQAKIFSLSGSYIIRDSAAALTSAGAILPVVAAAETVSITGAADLTTLALLRNAEVTTEYTTVVGSKEELLAHLASSGAGGYFVNDGITVHVTTPASLADLEQIDAANGLAPVAVTAITDNAARLADDLEGQHSRVADGVVVTVTDAASLAQLAAIDAANGGGRLIYEAVRDSAARLADDGGTYIKNGTDVVVEEAATVAELAAIDALNGDGELVYTTLSGVVGDLLGSDYLREGGDVEVTAPASLADLALIADTIGNGHLSYTSVADQVEHLVTNAGSYVTEGIDVTVTNAAGLGQLEIIDGYNGAGELSYTELFDTAVNLAADQTYVRDGIAVTVNGAATISQLTAIDGLNGSGTLNAPLVVDSWQALLGTGALSYTNAASTIRLTSYALGEVSVSDVARLLALPHLVDGSGEPIALSDLNYTLLDRPAMLAAGDAADIVTSATSVTASEPATVSQAVVILGRDSNAVYSISDSASSITGTSATTEAAVIAAVNLDAVTPATAAQAVVIHDRSAVGALHYDVTDNFINLDGLSAAVRNGAHDLTISGYSPGSYLGVLDAETVVTYTNSGSTTINNVRDTAERISAFVSANQETAGDQGLHYDFTVYDSASGALAAIDAGHTSFITGNAATVVGGDQRATYINIYDSFSVSGAMPFWQAVNDGFGGDVLAAANRSYYGVTGSVNHFANADTAGDWITKADHLHIVDTAANIYAAQNGQDHQHADIFPLLWSRNSGSDNITVTGSAGEQAVRGTAGNDFIDLGAGNDSVAAGGGSDVIYGGSGYDSLNGGAGKDTIYSSAGTADTVFSTALYSSPEIVVGGQGGDNLFAGELFDWFTYQGNSRAELIAESGTTRDTRDYITNFSIGDRIYFNGVSSVQFLGSGSANAKDTEGLGLAIRYDKNVQVLNYGGDAVVEGTRVLIDIVNEQGHFDEVADMHIVLIGHNVELNWDNGSLLFGG
ncbi:DUF4214 domain-containing protein [Roseomonas sp. GCM10028921]